MQNLTKVFLALCLCLVFCKAQTEFNPYPLIVTSNENLEELSSFLFTECNEFMDVYFNKYTKTSTLPKKNIFYVISTPYDSLKTIDFITQNHNKYANLMDLLRNKKKTFSAKYIQYSYPQILNYISQKYKNSSSLSLKQEEYDFNSSDFQLNHKNLLNSTEPSLETIHFDIFSIKDLNVLLYHDLKALSKISPDSYSIFIGFKANEQIHNFRILAEETSTEETSTSSENSTTTLINLPNSDATNPTLRIMPYVMTGYLFTLLALFVVLVGAMALCSVQAPDKFPRLPLLVGRESN